MLAEFGVGQVLWSMIWFFLFFMWIMLVFRVFGDIMRSRDLSGVAKALWVMFVIFMPYLGVFVYLIARGGNMAENEIRSMQAQDEMARAYIRDAAGASASPAEELSKLAALRDQGVLDDAEFQRLKAKVVG
jgi:hypothetical protein